TPVLGWEANTNEVRVKTKVQEFVARRLVITAGPWALMLLRDLQLPLEIKRKTLVWFDPLVPEHFREGSLPIFAFATHFFYGFPNIWEKGLKVGLHEGGDIIAAMPARAVTTQDLDPIVQAVSKFLPSLSDPQEGPTDRLLRAQTCLYTMTPDEH